MIQELTIGRVFTPARWAKWLIETTRIFEAWLDGANILDPTCGDGDILEAFISVARQRGAPVSKSDLSRLHGIEIVASDKQRFLSRMKHRYGLSFPDKNWISADFITQPNMRKFDALVGNPPWVNFTELPDDLKTQWGPIFIKYGLVRNKSDVILGSSRADVASLVLKKAIDDFLEPEGVAAFFIPLSIFFNSGANDRFRPHPHGDYKFCVSKLWDFAEEKIFDGVATRYGAALFHRDATQTWPVPTEVRQSRSWKACFSTATDGRSGHWQRHETRELPSTLHIKIEISKSQKPRQGINTCGANDVMVFDRHGDIFYNGFGDKHELEQEMMFPLMNARTFKKDGKFKEKWILVPYDRRTGRPLEWEGISNFKLVADYLSKHRRRLMGRKGTFINGFIGRGYWWALLGVGPYSFAPWKVAWQALGSKQFRPVAVEGKWQGNQAMHAFCPCATKEDADRLCRSLKADAVENWLKSSTMEGTCNWAQPGRISKILSIRPDQNDLFALPLSSNK